MSVPTWPFSLASDRPIDVACLGHALVDRLAHAGSEVVAAAGLEPGAMTLVDGDGAAAIEAAHRGWREAAGGSAANTAAGIASLGGSPAFAGSIGADEAGRRYVTHLEASGVRCVAHEVASGSPTGVCHVFVGPEGERSMATSLGAAGELAASAIEEVEVAKARVLYLEGYLLDAAPAAAALEKSIGLAKGAGTLVSLSLSDPFVVERHREQILELVDGGTVDLLFGNEDEARALTGAASLGQAVARLVRPGSAVVVTRGAAGSVVATEAGQHAEKAAPVEVVEDTTGAGDLFAAGVLYGLVDGRDPSSSLRVGSLAAAEIISHLGARPLVRLAELLGA